MILFSAAVSAQDAVDRSELERCARLGTSIEKLACFESLASPPAQPEVVGGQGVIPDAADDRIPGASADAEAAADETGSESTTAAGMPPADDTGARTASPVAGPDLGSEHLERDVADDRPEMVTARVQEVWKGGNRLLYFQFTNGQVWRQMESGYFFYPRDEEFDVTIRQGMMGDYQMRLEGRARMTRIVRVR